MPINKDAYLSNWLQNSQNWNFHNKTSALRGFIALRMTSGDLLHILYAVSCLACILDKSNTFKDSWIVGEGKVGQD